MSCDKLYHDYLIRQVKMEQKCKILAKNIAKKQCFIRLENCDIIRYGVKLRIMKVFLLYYGDFYWKEINGKIFVELDKGVYFYR